MPLFYNPTTAADCCANIAAALAPYPAIDVSDELAALVALEGAAPYTAAGTYAHAQPAGATGGPHTPGAGSPAW